MEATEPKIYIFYIAVENYWNSLMIYFDALQNKCIFNILPHNIQKTNENEKIVIHFQRQDYGKI